jgi:hypothetical protein
MKALKVPENTAHILLVEEADRLIYLENDQTAIVLGTDQDKDGELRVSIHFPMLDEDQPAGLPMILAAACRVFLNDPEWVEAARLRMEEQQKKAKEEETSDTEESTEEQGDA